MWREIRNVVIVVISFFRTRALAKLRKVLEWIFIVISIITVIKEIIAYTVGENYIQDLQLKATLYVQPIIPFVIKLYTFLPRVFNVPTLIFICILLFVIERQQRRIAVLSGENNAALTDIASYENYRKNYTKCERTFHALASQNAQHDARLFSTLFIDYPHGSLPRNEINERIRLIKAAATVVRSNLVNVLDAATKLFEAMTGEDCAACVQALRHVGANIDDADVETIERDSESAPIRTKPSDKHKIGENSLSRRVFVDRAEFVIEADLASQIERGAIRSTSRNVGRSYNAVFIIPVPNVDDENAPVVSSLCIDNMKGIPAEVRDVCIHFGKELAWRVGVMHYRLEFLLRRMKELERKLP